MASAELLALGIAFSKKIVELAPAASEPPCTKPSFILATCPKRVDVTGALPLWYSAYTQSPS